MLDLRLYLTDNILYLSLPISKIAEFTHKLKYYGNIYDENLRLRAQNNELISYYQNLSRLVYENLELKSSLKFINESKLKYITTKILSNISGPYQRKSIIMSGKKDNVKKGQIIVSNMDIVGRIIEVGEKYSRVLHINDITSKIPIILPNSGLKAIAAGNGGSLLDIQYLPENSNINAGEIVITSGDIDLFPADFTVGHTVFDNDNKLKIKPVTDINKLNFVSVIIY